MKELLAQSSNLLLVPILDKPAQVQAHVELILICTEPVYNYSAGGLSSTREVSDFRVLCSQTALRDMGKKMIELADELKSLDLVMNDALKANTNG